MKRTILNLIIITIAALFASCDGKKDTLLDKELKTFCVNGISAVEGQEKIIKSLKDIGFVMDKDGVQESDLTIFDKERTFYAVFNAKSLTDEQISRLTSGLFDNLPSKIPFSHIMLDNGCRVYLSWYPTGEVNKCSIFIGDYAFMMEGDCIEVNKRLSEMFPHSKLANSYTGYKTYYDDNGVEVYYTNSYTLMIEKKSK